MTASKTFREMTDQEIGKAFSRLAIQCQHCDNPVEVFKRLAKEDLGCPHTVAVTFSKSNGAGQRMWMGMVGSPTTGKTISF